MRAVKGARAEMDDADRDDFRIIGGTIRLCAADRVDEDEAAFKG